MSWKILTHEYVDGKHTVEWLKPSGDTEIETFKADETTIDVQGNTVRLNDEVFIAGSNALYKAHVHRITPKGIIPRYVRNGNPSHFIPKERIIKCPFI